MNTLQSASNLMNARIGDLVNAIVVAIQAATKKTVTISMLTFETQQYDSVNNGNQGFINLGNGQDGVHAINIQNTGVNPILIDTFIVIPPTGSLQLGGTYQKSRLNGVVRLNPQTSGTAWQAAVTEIYENLVEITL